MNIEFSYSQEKLIPALKNKYESLGYRKYKMNKFEEYDLYLENKSFLKSENIITFNDINGKLLALKPDVTLSIVKNSDSFPEKVYYTENVYRVKSGQYKEIMQVGLEFLGTTDNYTICEVISLAVSSLAEISENYALDISHMGFISGILDELSLSSSDYDAVLKCISQKNAHEINAICEKNNIDSKLTENLIKLSTLHGNIKAVIDKCSALNINEKTNKAFGELLAIYKTLEAMGASDKINIDFSIVNDIGYYNGIIFQGFIDGIAESILSGGSYDNLLAKMNKRANAIGFAIYLDLLEFYSQDNRSYDVDVMLLYGEDTDPADLSKKVKELNEGGQSVLAATAIPKKLSYKQILDLTKGD